MCSYLCVISITIASTHIHIHIYTHIYIHEEKAFCSPKSDVCVYIYIYTSVEHFKKQMYNSFFCTVEGWLQSLF